MTASARIHADCLPNIGSPGTARAIINRWHQGFDTYAIGKALKLTEREVASALSRYRDAVHEKLHGGSDWIVAGEQIPAWVQPRFRPNYRNLAEAYGEPHAASRIRAMQAEGAR